MKSNNWSILANFGNKNDDSFYPNQDLKKACLLTFSESITSLLL